MNQELIRMSTLSVQDHKGVPRIWLEGKYLARAGFKQGCNISVKISNDEITIVLDNSGERIVSKKRTNPVIDVNNKEILSVFKISEKVNALIKFGNILISKTKKAVRKALALKDRTFASVFSGGGLLDQAAALAGFKSKWGIEINKDYADVWQLNHSGVMYNCDIADIDYSKLEQVELLVGGIPCEPFSPARKNTNHCSVDEHPNADLSMFFLMVVEAVNPRIIVLEEVPAYLKSGIGIATISALKRLGYNVGSRIVTGKDFGEFAIRKRVVIVASLDAEINFPIGQSKEHIMKEILHNPEDSRCDWFNKDTKPFIFKMWNKKKSKGHQRFISQMITEESTHVSTIPKGYFKQQAGNPVVKHPTKEDTYRWLSLDEVKKIMGVQDDFVLADSKMISGEILGQGVLVTVFQKVIEHLMGKIV